MNDRVLTSPFQAPASSVDVFGSLACSGPAAAPAAATQSLQNLQDLAMMGFSDHKRYKVRYILFSLHSLIGNQFE